MARGADRLQAAHLRHRPQEARSGALHCFLLDCSASMRHDGQLARAKGQLLALMQEAYQRRDHVALLCFAGDVVELRLPPRRASAWNDDWVAPIAAGGGTPLALGVLRAQQLLAKHESRQRWLWLLTDGRSNESPARPAAADVACVMDFRARPHAAAPGAAIGRAVGRPLPERLNHRIAGRASALVDRLGARRDIRSTAHRCRRRLRYCGAPNETQETPCPSLPAAWCAKARSSTSLPTVCRSATRSISRAR
ncbi:VWA domain-containing protein [Variovorax boronicumulans]|uniref:vWA domain-containing protein n=1 Tax=Variovorax boronicumulans TaxID=436515 RepID=UPI0036F3A791